jgi:hypothetical protein
VFEIEQLLEQAVLQTSILCAELESSRIYFKAVKAVRLRSVSILKILYWKENN